MNNMEAIETFKDVELENYNIYGGKLYATEMKPGTCDTWDDKDDSGTISPGDDICYHECYM